MPVRRTKRPTGVKHPNATLTKSQVSKIWKLSGENGWGSRRIAAALNLPDNKRGVVEKVLYGISYKEFLPESKRPRGLSVNDRGDEIHVFDCSNPERVVVIRDGVARCTGYDVETPVSNVEKMTLRDFEAVLGGFVSIRKEQAILDEVKKVRQKVDKARERLKD